MAQRRPELELPAGCVIEEAVSIHGGGFESYDFHGAEVLHPDERGGQTARCERFHDVADGREVRAFEAVEPGDWPAAVPTVLRPLVGVDVDIVEDDRCSATSVADE